MKVVNLMRQYEEALQVYVLHWLTVIQRGQLRREILKDNI